MVKAITVDRLHKEFVNIPKSGLTGMLTGNVVTTVVLDDITFSVPRGEILGVIGKNGSGKSTLLRLLAGVYHKTSGVVHLSGTPSTLFEMGVFMDVYATGRSYCMDYYEFMRISKKEIPQMISFVKDFTELGEDFELPVYQYSAGMMARLLFAVTASMPAAIYLIDEALVVGDQYFQDKAWNRLFYLLSQGASGILVTHDFHSLQRLCPHTIVIEDGRVSFYGDTQNAIKKYLKIADIPATDPAIGFLRQETLRGEKEIHAESGKPFVLPYSVQIKKLPLHEEAYFSLHIERQKQYGGNVMVAAVEQPIQLTQCGVYHCDVSVDKLNLGAGEYVLSLAVGYIPKSSYGYYTEIYDEWKCIPFFVEDNVPKLGAQKDNPLMTSKLEWRI